MKRNLLRLLFIGLVFTVFNTGIISQVPQGFNYMAIARDGAGDIIKNEPLGVYIAILEGDYTIVYDETHSVSTNSTGLFKIVIGTGTPMHGGYVAEFSDINWKMQPLYIQTVITYNGSDIDMGHAELLSVPYAMLSQATMTGIDNSFTLSGPGDTVIFSNPVRVVSSYEKTDEEALFAVRRKDGQTMFAVYNQGVRINIPMDDLIKGAKGGFAIGGFSGSKGTTHNLFVLNKDSARIFLDKTPDLLPKGAKGGFAIGGFAYAGKEDIIQNYLYVAPDSARIYVQNPAKGVKGGFAIGGFATTGKGPSTNFMDITPDNYFIGHESGTKLDKINPGSFNSVIGYQAGKGLTTGSYNTILGYNAGISATSGEENIIIGRNSGHNLTSGIHNTLIGNAAGYNHTNQEYNVMIGTSAGANIIASGWAGSFNTFMGINSGYQIRNSKENVFLGTNSGYWIDNGRGNTIIGIDAGRSRPDPGFEQPPWPYRPEVEANYNTIIGDKAAYLLTTSSNNVIVGNEAGYNITDGDGNVFLGNQAGYNETGTGKLYVTNKIADPPLMYGDFTVNQLGINTKTLGKTLSVGGDAYVSGNLSAGSITAPITGNVTGNLTGNVTGNVNGNLTGNVTGNVEGTLTGSVNGVETGKIYLENSGPVQNTARGAFRLDWNKEGVLILTNDHDVLPCGYWYKIMGKGVPVEVSGMVDPKNDWIIEGLNQPGISIEIHFGQAHPDGGFCSIWVQFFEGILAGHYIKY